jgi:hypothetical protein
VTLDVVNANPGFNLSVNYATAGSYQGSFLDAGNGNDTLDGEDAPDTPVGSDGADILNGGDGSDILRGGAGNDTLDGEGATGNFDLIDLSDGTAGVTFTLVQSSSQTTINLSSIGLSTAAGDKYANMEGVMGTDFNDTLNGSAFADELRGGGGNDSLNGNAGNDILKGDAGTDTLNGGADNDTLVGGAGADTLGGGTGVDTFVLTDAASIDTITDYQAGEIIDITALLTAAGPLSGFVRLTAGGDLQLDADGGGNGYTTIAHINASGVNATVTYSTGPGATATATIVSGAPPVAFDLNGDGVISFLAADAGATFDYGVGMVATAWVGPQDGILVRDANADGLVTPDEMVFATSGSDLEGLAVYDSNHDGQLSAADEHFAEFAVWQDANSDGQVDAGELGSLTARTIASISLSSDGVGYAAAGGDVQVIGSGSFTRIDGSTGVLADAVFATGSRSFDEQFKAATGLAGAGVMAGAVAAAGLAAIASSPQGDDHGTGQSASVGSTELSSFVPVASAASEDGRAVPLENFTLHSVDSQLPIAQANGAATGESSHSLMGAETVEAAAPMALLQSTEAPVPVVPMSQPTIAQAGIAIPPAEALAVAFPSDAGGPMHTQELSHVLADALAGGSDGPSIDNLLASLPTQADGELSNGLHALADTGFGHPSWDVGNVMPVIHADLMADAATHMDAVAYTKLRTVKAGLIG